MAKPVEIKGPLTLGGKIKAGVKGFFKTVLHYIPKGLLIGGAILGGSMLIGGPVASFMHVSPDTFLERLGFTMLVGSAISGGVGAWQAVSQASNQRNAEIQAQQDELERCRACGPELQLAMDPIAPTGLPPLSKQQRTGKLPVSAHVGGL